MIEQKSTTAIMCDSRSLKSHKYRELSEMEEI